MMMPFVVLMCTALLSGAQTAVTPGCYVDGPLPHRVLPSMPMPIMDPRIDADTCNAACASKNYTLGGLEAGHACFCGDELVPPIKPQRPMSECCTPCIANSSQVCGGEFRILIFSVGKPPVQPPPLCPQINPIPVADPRHIRKGVLMLTAGYLDQPYCVTMQPKKRDLGKPGRWVCTITGSTGGEGSAGEHVLTLFSDDSGMNWSHPVSVEPSPVNTALANAYSTILTAPGMAADGGERIYTLYNMNVHNVTDFPSGAKIGRTDCQGNFVMRYSDDGAESWSPERILVPYAFSQPTARAAARHALTVASSSFLGYRLTAVDRDNEWKGEVREMWTVDQTKFHKGTAFFAFTKIGHYLLAPPEEMWVLASRNILTENNASLVKWNLLPDGEHGVPPPFHNVSQEDTIVEEAHVLPLPDGFYMVGRTALGYLAASWTTNTTAAGGWQPTQYAQYWDPSSSEDVQRLRPLSHSALDFGGVAPDGAGLKNPRGPITAREITAGPLAGLYLLLYYNNACNGYTSTARNPYWLTVGRPAANGPKLLWAQPEIVLYDTLRDTHPGYPDIIQDPADPARIVITETQKTIARLHEIPHRILDVLETQHSVRALAGASGVKRTIVKKQDNVKMLKTPQFPTFNATVVPHMGDGFSMGFVLQHHSKAQPGDILIDSRSTQNASDKNPAGVAVTVSNTSRIMLSLSDGETLVKLETDSVCTKVLDSAPDPNQLHFVGFVVDAGPRILRVAVDGVLCDGGAPSATSPPLGAPEGHGFAFFNPLAGDIRGSDQMRLAPTYGGDMVELQLYERALLTSELVGNYRECCAKNIR